MKKKVWIPLIILVITIIASSILYKKYQDSIDIASINQENEVQKSASVSNINHPALNFSFTNEDDKSFMLADFIGKPIVLNFWASWCPPCRNEMPIFQKAYDEYPEVTFLLINQTASPRESMSKALAFMKDHDLTMPIYFDRIQSAGSIYQLTALPQTYFIDAEGEIIARIAGETTEELFKANLEKIL